MNKSFSTYLLKSMQVKMILPRNRLQSLHLTSCIDIKFLQKVKHCTQWYHYGNKIDVGITDDNDCAQNTKKLADQASEDRWYGYIYDVNILEENNFFHEFFTGSNNQFQNYKSWIFMNYSPIWLLVMKNDNETRKICFAKKIL